MSRGAAPRVFSVPPGAPFLPTLAEALLTGRLVPGFRADGDPLALAGATIYLPTRRAARALRALFVERSPAGAAILPTIRALGEFDEETNLLQSADGAALDIAPPIGNIDRLLALAPLVQAWKGRLPAHVVRMIGEEVVVPASAADAVWLAADLARLIDEMETHGVDPARLAGLVEGDLAAWWQVTLEFLRIATAYWPRELAERQRSNPAAYRDALIRAEARRLGCHPPAGPVIAAGSTGSIPATAALLRTIARLPAGAVVLPGLDLRLDEEAWALLGDPPSSPSICGHPQFGLKRLVAAIGVDRGGVTELGTVAPPLRARSELVSEALRPAATTDRWIGHRAAIAARLAAGALDGVTLVEAPNEREEALAAAHALRRAVSLPGRRAALVTGDRALARRVVAELLRYGIHADDSAGTRLSQAPAAMLLGLLAEATLKPGDPVAILAFLKLPLLRLGMKRAAARRAVEAIELVALRGGTGRPDILRLASGFEERLAQLEALPRKPAWFARLHAGARAEARDFLARLSEALEPLAALRMAGTVGVVEAARATVEALEAVGRDDTSGLGGLYRGEAGERLAEFLRELVAARSALAFHPHEWPGIIAALMAGETVKPRQGADRNVAIWGVLEARLQGVDTLVCGGLNEASWPARADPDGFMSRFMKTGIELDPPERRIGQAAHDFVMAMGSAEIVLTRAARQGDAPSVPSRWLQRLTACIGEDPSAGMRRRGAELLAAARRHAGDAPENVPFARRPRPAPPVEARPRRFSVTEIETLRRDPYAVFARRILRLDPLEPLQRDPGVVERGSLFHDILRRFVESGDDAGAPEAVARLVAIGRRRFEEERLPPDIDAVWWPRFVTMAPKLIDWERRHRAGVLRREAEVGAEPIDVGRTGTALSGRADRIDERPNGIADILDYKTGSYPSKRQAHMLVSPQLALEGALLMRGAFDRFRTALRPADLAYVRLKATGEVEEESILSFNRQVRSAADLAEEAWQRLERLLGFYRNAANGYLSRALPFREGDTGDYDHLARVQEWSAGGDDGEAEE